MDENVLFFLAGILIVGGLMFGMMALTKRSPRPLDVQKYRTRWLAIEQQLKNGEETSYQLSVMNADKLLDQALRERAYSGQTMGERMKSAQSKWSNANAVWSAHKLRNQIAHETTVKVDFGQARAALGAFKQALKDVGAI